MSWPDAMGLIVIEGLLICVLVVTGLREAIMHAIPPPSSRPSASASASSSRSSASWTPASSPASPAKTAPCPSSSGHRAPLRLAGPGLLPRRAAHRRAARPQGQGRHPHQHRRDDRRRGRRQRVRRHRSRRLGPDLPAVPDDLVAAPDFGLLGYFGLFGAFQQVGVLTVVLLVFTLILSDFFDTMGTVVGVTPEAGLLDEDGQVPHLGRVLLIDGAAAVAGGAASASSATSYVESAAGVGEGARTGFASPRHRRPLRRGALPHPARDDRPRSRRRRPPSSRSASC